ncbi:hypothetical protein ACVI1N_004495 [Sinorhizobium medicae]
MDDAWTLDFPPIGRFVKVTVKEREYWYFDQSDGEGGQKRKYVGPAEDPEISKRVEDFSRTKSDYRIRRRLVSSLTRDGGLLAADRTSGLIVETLAAAGLFRLRTVLVGTLAFARSQPREIKTQDSDIFTRKLHCNPACCRQILGTGEAMGKKRVGAQRPIWQIKAGAERRA